MRLISTFIFLLLVCTISAQNSKDDPIENFEKLWLEFNQRYANFELKSVNWQDTYEKYRPQITKNSTSDEVFTICCEMLQELNDGHVNLFGKTNVNKKHCGSSTSKFHLIEEFGNIGNLMPLVGKTLKKENFTSVRPKNRKGKIRYATSNDYGYLFISQFTGFNPRKLNKLMNKAINEFENKKGIIIDVRINGGGEDRYAYEIAGRFADKKRLGHLKKERIKGTQNFTELESHFLNPIGEKQFTKPIIILTSNYSASATELFLIAMKELPYVTIIGNRTEGILSDMFPFSLPNGWQSTLSHQQYFTTDMVNYEGKGIEPDFKILNYKKDEFDNVLLKAIELLDNF